MIREAILFLVLAFILPLTAADSGTSLYSSGDYSGAISAFEGELQDVSGSTQAPVLNNIGTCYVSLGLPEKAAEYYTRAVTVDPSYGRGWINLGVVQERLGRQDEALISYGRVSGDPALQAEAAVKKGTLLVGQQKLDEALSAFKSAETGASGQVAVDMYTGIGSVEFILGDTTSAEKAFVKATELDPSGAAMAWTNLGVLRILQQRYVEAKTSFDTAIANDPLGKTKAASYLQKLEAMGVI